MAEASAAHPHVSHADEAVLSSPHVDNTLRMIRRLRCEFSSSLKRVTQERDRSSAILFRELSFSTAVDRLADESSNWIPTADDG